MSKTKLTERLNRILPMFGVIPLAACLLANAITYYGSRLITKSLTHYDLSLPLDELIPFVPSAILIYVLAFVSWVIGFVVIARESKTVCYEYLSGEIIGKFICMVFFFIVPTTIVRPEVSDGGFCNWLTQIIYSSDSPDNLFPSIHCLESWFCFRASLKCKKVGNAYKVIMGVFAVLVFASTVLVKQHFFIDIIAGVAVAEIGMLLSHVTGAGRIFETINNKISGRFTRNGKLQNER